MSQHRRGGVAGVAEEDWTHVGSNIGSADQSLALGGYQLLVRVAVIQQCRSPRSGHQVTPKM